jgi:hypothetical protein
MMINKFIQLLGLLSVAIGLLTILGYAAGDPGLYTWFGDNGQAYNTAVTDILQGLALYLIGCKLKTK